MLIFKLQVLLLLLGVCMISSQGLNLQYDTIYGHILVKHKPWRLICSFDDTDVESNQRHVTIYKDKYLYLKQSMDSKSNLRIAKNLPGHKTVTIGYTVDEDVKTGLLWLNFDEFKDSDNTTWFCSVNGFKIGVSMTRHVSADSTKQISEILTEALNETLINLKTSKPGENVSFTTSIFHKRLNDPHRQAKIALLLYPQGQQLCLTKHNETCSLTAAKGLSLKATVGSASSRLLRLPFMEAKDVTSFTEQQLTELEMKEVQSTSLVEKRLQTIGHIELVDEFLANESFNGEARLGENSRTSGTKEKFLSDRNLFITWGVVATVLFILVATSATYIIRYQGKINHLEERLDFSERKRQQDNWAIAMLIHESVVRGNSNTPDGNTLDNNSPKPNPMVEQASSMQREPCQDNEKPIQTQEKIRSGRRKIISRDEADKNLKDVATMKYNKGAIINSLLRANEVELSEPTIYYMSSNDSQSMSLGSDYVEYY